MTPNGVGIVCALAREARHLGGAGGCLTEPLPQAKAASRVVRMVSLDDGTLLAISGMGGAAARSAADTLIDAGVRALASWGMAGGLDPTLAPGTVCLPEEVTTPDGKPLRTTDYWRERLGCALSGREAVHRGRLLTVGSPVGSPADKAALHAQTGAVAVDMESAAVAEVARGRGLPFIAVRVIVDGAHDVLPRTIAAAADQSGEVHLWQLIGALARTPADLAPMIRLARRYRSASRSLAAVARTAPLARLAFPGGPDTARP